MELKTVKVVAAIIVDSGKVLSCKRGYGKHKGGWEFPGGKIENGETFEEAVKREIKEELDIEIEVERFFMDIEHDYEDFHLSMKCYICSLKGEMPRFLEHEDFKWLNKEELYSVEWLKADIAAVDKLYKEL